MEHIAGWMPGRQITWRHRRLHRVMRSHAVDALSASFAGAQASLRPRPSSRAGRACPYVYACATDMRQEPRPSSRPLGCLAAASSIAGRGRTWSVPLRDRPACDAITGPLSWIPCTGPVRASGPKVASTRPSRRCCLGSTCPDASRSAWWRTSTLSLFPLRGYSASSNPIV